tara:strand:- start:244 stop:630 length:387 start_codon:yes stop_codon:yes gene_type:complete
MSVRFWEKAMYADLEKDRSWYSVSLPFHHPSTFEGDISKEVITEELLAELLAKPIDALIPEGKFHLVGHSLGGFAALNYAAKFPDRVASIVSVGGFPRGGLMVLKVPCSFFRRVIFSGKQPFIPVGGC